MSVCITVAGIASNSEQSSKLPCAVEVTCMNREPAHLEVFKGQADCFIVNEVDWKFGCFGSHSSLCCKFGRLVTSKL